jgi:alkane 1-monooxygenase
MTAGSTEDTTMWQDRKRGLWLMGLIVPTLLLAVLPIVWAMNQLGWQTASQAWFWIGPILLYVVLPALDLRFGADGQNPPDEAMKWLEDDKYYRYCTYAFIPFQYLSLVLGAYLFTASNLSWLGFEGSLSWPAKIGLALSVGTLGGVGINTAHEMGHFGSSCRAASLAAFVRECGWRPSGSAGRAPTRGTRRRTYPTTSSTPG